ncbi:MAG: glycosyltransferase family 4 protein [Chloroflexi bacterium]|nr:glycosyltransferase family 4 protein [Chloroflexota bacterium]
MMVLKRWANKPPLMVIGSYVFSSGFTRVIQHIISQAQNYFAIHYWGIGYNGPFIDNGCKIYPWQADTSDYFGVTSMKAVVEQVRPKLVFIVHDLWYLGAYLRGLEPFADEMKIVTYTPLDGNLRNPQLLSPLRLVDRCIFYTHYGQKCVEQFWPQWQQEAGVVKVPDFGIIPHGVDTDTFYPLTGSVEAQFEGVGRLKAKRAVFPGESDLADSFIVLNANRPTPRKRIDLTMKGFALFAQDKPANVKLYLHHTLSSYRIRNKVLELAKEYGILERLILNPIIDGKSGVSDERLNLIYNVCDVGINTAMGEGWGLVSCEHAATGAAQIVPRHTACAEIWAGAADFLDPIEKKTPWFSPFEMYSVSPEEVAQKLEKLYQDRNYQRDMAIAGYQRVTEPQYDWQRISRQWSELFQEMLEL